MDELDSLEFAKLNLFRNRFSCIREELKTVFNNKFGICKDDEIKIYRNETEELFEILDEKLATIAGLNSKGNVNKNDINNIISNYNEIKLPIFSLPPF